MVYLQFGQIPLVREAPQLLHSPLVPGFVSKVSPKDANTSVVLEELELAEKNSCPKGFSSDFFSGPADALIVANGSAVPMLAKLLLKVEAPMATAGELLNSLLNE